jgi:3-carboxy-cis,cis-muconate cycloisomerase
VPARFIDSLATTEPLAEIFSDHSFLEAMLDFEAALARAEAHAGIVPKRAAAAIGRAARAQYFDASSIVRQTLRAGTAGIPIAKALTARVGQASARAARFVHWGATSQDVTDTALVLLLKRARPILGSDWARLERALHRISDTHKNTVMVGRTLLQAALPITFGLKAAGWLGALRRSQRRMEAAFTEALVLQFGGASGTLAALGKKGLRVGQRMAIDLGLAYPDAPWHSHRDRLGALVAAAGVLTASLGKMARDISLLMQNELREVVEPRSEERGGSSAMPQKQNPIASAVTLAAANRVPGLVAAFLSGMVQEHERGVGGWQAEWPTVGGVIQSTGLALRSMAEAAEGLRVDERRMRGHIDATHGVIFAEKAALVLAGTLGRDKARRIVKEAVQKAEREQRNLATVLAEVPEVSAVLHPNTLRDLETPEKYLGVAEPLRKRLLFASQSNRS